MLLKTYTILTLFVLLLNNAAGQNPQTYIDSINRYQHYVDALVNSFYADPSVKLGHTIVHYNCASGERGGSADLYENAHRDSIYSFEYMSFCDTVPDQRTYYFVNNKIVLVLMTNIPAHAMDRAKYYRNDNLISENGNLIEAPKANDKDLLRGYEILKDFSFKHH